MHAAGEGEAGVVRLASAQHGLVTRRQLEAAGIGRGVISRRVRCGRLFRTTLKGVYLLGRPNLEPLARELGAILYFDGDAILSHASACWLWGYIPSAPPEVTVTLIGGDARSRAGLRVHRVPALERADIRVRDGMAVAEAVGLRHTSARELEQALARAPGRTGTARIRALLEAGTEPADVRSRCERMILTLIRRANLPEPLVNKPLHGFRIDMRWPEHRLALEIDGHRFHATRAAFERDRRRDQVLAAVGYTVIRVTYRQILEEPYAVLARLAMALQARAA
jgi:very-short-patch-repair endonuclease